MNVCFYTKFAPNYPEKKNGGGPSPSPCTATNVEKPEQREDPFTRLSTELGQVTGSAEGRPRPRWPTPVGMADLGWGGLPWPTTWPSVELGHSSRSCLISVHIILLLVHL